MWEWDLQKMHWTVLGIVHSKSVMWLPVLDDLWSIMWEVAPPLFPKHHQYPEMSSSCGAQLQDADIPAHLKDVVYVWQMSCEDPIEKLYYSAKFADICVYCGVAVDPWSDTQPYYPQCEGCREKPPIANAKKSGSVPVS